MEDLKELFRIMMDEDTGISWHEGWHGKWHPNYKRFSGEAIRRAEGVRRGDLISASDSLDRKFLEWLIFHSHRNDAGNGIASVSLSMLKKENYEILIGDEGFMKALNAYANSPGLDTYTDLYRKWEEISRVDGFNFTRARVNRVAAAFTTDVSAFVCEEKFWKAYQWLVGQGVLENKFRRSHTNWFMLNEYAMQVLRREFKKELESGATDIYWLNMFICFIWNWNWNGEGHDPFPL